MISAHIIELSKDDLLDLITKDISENPEKYKVPKNFCGQTIHFQISVVYHYNGSINKFSVILRQKKSE